MKNSQQTDKSNKTKLRNSGGQRKKIAINEDPSYSDVHAEGGDDAGGADPPVPMAKVGIHPSHRGTTYIPRALREGGGSKAKRAPSPELEDAEEVYMFDGEEKTGMVPKRVRRKYTGGTPGRGKKGDEDADVTGGFGAADIEQEGQYAPEESDTELAVSPDKAEKEKKGKKRKKSSKTKVPPLAGVGENDEDQDGRSHMSGRSKGPPGGKKRKRSTRKKDEAAYESHDQGDDDFGGPVPAGEQEEPVEKEKLKCSLTMDSTMDEFEENGGSAAFADNVAGSLGLKKSQVEVTGVREGSVIVDYEITEDAETGMSLSEIQQTQDEKIENNEMDVGAPIKSHKASVVKPKKPKKSKGKKDKDQDQDILAEHEFETPGGPTPGDGEESGVIEAEPVAPADLLIAPEPELLLKDDDQTLVPVSYAGVKLWQRRLHPRDPETGEPWGWWKADLKYVPLCSGMIKKTEWVTPEASSIGLGAVLYLYTMKAFAWLFLLLTLLNIPLMIFYVNGQGPYAKERVSSGQFTDVFAQLSIGNLGVTGFACSNFNLAAAHPTLRWNCPYGTMRELFSFGMQKLDNQSCTKSTGTYIGEGGDSENWDDLQIDCNLDYGMTAEGYQAFQDNFTESCYDQYECELEFDIEWLNTECRRRFEYYSVGSTNPYYALSQNWTWHRPDQRRREPVFMGVTFCIADKIYSPSGAEMGFTKQDFGYAISTIDIICVLLTVILINLLEVRFREYAKIYDKRNVELRDFTVAVENLPCDPAYGGKDILLQAYLWEHVEKHLRAAFEAKYLKSNNKAKLKELAQEKPWQIIDINFSKMDDQEQVLLGTMDTTYRTKMAFIHQLQGMQKAENAAEQEDKIQKLKEEILEQITLYREAKTEYATIQEDRLFEKYEITKENGRSEKDQTIKQAFITFRSMKGKDRCVHTFSGCEEAAKEDAAEEEKKFKDVWLDVQEALPPGAMQWQNIKYSFCCRTTITIVFWIVALFLVLLAFYLMILFKDYNDALILSAGLDAKCPSKPLDPHLVYEDWLKPPKQRAGYTHCFCLSWLQANGTVTLSEEAFRDAGWDESDLEEDQEPPCQDWQWKYENAFYLTIICGAMVGAINGVVCFIFEATGPLEKNLTYEGESRGIYNKIGMIQFLNIGVLFLLSDFTLGFEDDSKKGKKGAIKILMGKYTDFDTLWFYDVGAKITMAMISNSLAPHGKTFSEPIVKALLRWVLDRCFKRHLRKISNLDKPPAEKTKGEEQKEESVEMDKAPGVGADEESYEEDQDQDQDKDAVSNTEKEDEQNEGGDDGPQDEAPEDATPDEKKVDGEEKKEEPEVGEDECDSKILFQDDLNRFYTGEPILTWYIYAWFFTNMLIYYLYGGGMPLMYIFGFIFYSTCYLNYKYLFFSWNKQADMFNEDLALRSIGLVKWGVLFHLTTSLFMFSNKKLMTPADYTPEDHYAPKREAASRFFSRRFDNSQTMTVAVTCIVFVALYLFWRTIIKGCLWLFNAKNRKKKDFEEDDDAGGDEEAQAFQALAKEDHSDDFYRELAIGSLRDHYLRSNKEYEQFRTMANALSYDDELLSEEQCKFLKKTLKERIQMIEDTIDIHLNLIQGLERFMDRSYMYKLQVLEANEHLIQPANEKSLRVREFMQSYNIYDADFFYREKSVLQRVDRETLDLELLEKDLPVVC